MNNVSDELAEKADLRRRVRVVAAALALTASLLVIGSTGHPETGFVVIALVVAAGFVHGQIHGRRTREGIDERARDQQRWAANVSWQVTPSCWLRQSPG